MSMHDGLTEPVTCTNCGAVSVNGGSLSCWGCFKRVTEEAARLRVALNSELHYWAGRLAAAEAISESEAPSNDVIQSNYYNRDELHLKVVRETKERVDGLKKALSIPDK